VNKNIIKYLKCPKIILKQRNNSEKSHIDILSYIAWKIVFIKFWELFK
jgi:hypothetical protein